MLVPRVVPIGLLLATLIAAPTATTAQDDAEPVAANVNGQPVYAGDAERLVRESLKDRDISHEARQALVKQSLEQLISRRLILARLAKDNASASSDEVERAIKSLTARAERDKLSVEQWLKRNGFTAASLREEVSWRIGWRRYLESHVTDAVIEHYFEQHRSHWDGSQVRARHILWNLDRTRDATAEQAAILQAQLVRRQIMSGTLSFAQAAQKHSSAPSRSEEGDLGYLPRHGVMDEAFSRATFDLEPGQISSPVVTPFGVHLIQCVEIRPGDKTWKDRREELHLAVAQVLFDRLAAEERSGATITYPSPEQRPAK